MKRSPQEKLYQLINTLSKNEKRIITIYLSNSNNHAKNSLRLFTEICESNIIDIAVFEKKLTWAKNLSKLKYDLYYQILAQLSNVENNELSQLKSKVQQIKILFKKGLFQAGHKEIDNCIKKAKGLEEHLLLEELYELKLSASTFNQVKDIKEIEDVIVNAATHLNTYKINMMASGLASAIAQTFRLNTQKKKEYHQVKNYMLELERLYDTGQFTTGTLIKYYSVIISYHEMTGNYNKMYLTAKENYHLVIKNIPLNKTHCKKYITALVSYAYSCLFTSRFNEMDDVLKKLTQIDTNSISEKLLIFEQSSMINLRMLLTTGQLDKALELEQVITDGIAEHQKILRDFYLKIIYLELAATMLFSGKKRKALRYINVVLDYLKSPELNALNPIIKLANIIIHIELENDYLVENLILSYKRCCKRDSCLTPFEKWALSFLNDFIKTGESTNFYKKHLQSLEVITSLPEHKHLIMHFNIKAWLMKKTGNYTIENALLITFEELCKIHDPLKKSA